MRTYVVRLAALSPPPAEADAAEPALCGVVDDVQSGERTPFRSAEELLGVLRAAGAPGS